MNPHSPNTPAPARRFLRLLFVATAILSLTINTIRLGAAAVDMDKFGVCVTPQGYSDPDTYCDKLIAAGIKWVRISPEWGSIETARGIHNQTYLTKLDGIVDRLRAGGVNIVYILCYTAPWASSQPTLPWPDISRHKPANWADWENYVTFITDRYNGKIFNWEIWNEPDFNAYWKDSIGDYGILLQKAHARIKQTNPANTAVLGGLALFNNGADTYGLGTFFDQLLDLGYGSYFDVINYHAYQSLGRHGRIHQGMVDVINKHSLQAKPLWITETGYSTDGDTSREAMKADMVNQIHFNDLRWDDVDRYFLYRFNNITLTPPYPTEENFGLVSTSLTPLPAFRHFQASGGAETDFAAQAAYPALHSELNTLYYYPATSGEGSYITASGNDRTIATNSFMYFRVSDDWLYDANGGLDSSVFIDLTYLDSGTGSFALHYDAASNAHKGISQPLSNSGKWKTVTYAITDAKFANRQSYYSDFRIYSGATAGITVRKVAVRKIVNHASVIFTSVPKYKLMTYYMAASGEADNAVATQGGVECRSLTANSKYMYCAISDGIVNAADRNLKISVTFWDSGLDRIMVQYNALGNPYKPLYLAKTNTNAWRTVDFNVTDASFAGTQVYNCDLRISNAWDGSIEYIRSLSVSRNDISPKPVAAVVLSAGSPSKLMTYISGAGEADNAVVLARGVECRSIASNSKYLYFDVTDPVVTSSNRSVAITVKFLDSGTDSLALHYNAVGNPYKIVNIAKTNTNEWRAVRLVVPDANFANSQNFGGDFRLSNAWDGSAEYVSRLECVALD